MISIPSKFKKLTFFTCKIINWLILVATLIKSVEHLNCGLVYEIDICVEILETLLTEPVGQNYYLIRFIIVLKYLSIIRIHFDKFACLEF